MPFGLRITGVLPCGRAEQLEKEIKIAWQVSRGSAMACFFFSPLLRTYTRVACCTGKTELSVLSVTRLREAAPCSPRSPSPPQPGAVLCSGTTAVQEAMQHADDYRVETG